MNLLNRLTQAKFKYTSTEEHYENGKLTRKVIVKKSNQHADEEIDSFMKRIKKDLLSFWEE